jgi:hypothetical protein
MEHNGVPMAPNPSDLFQEWRVADQKAHAMEQSLFKASMASLTGDGEAPSEQEREQGRHLRVLANDLFHLAMDEMKARAERNRY